MPGQTFLNESGTSNQANGYITYLGAPNRTSKIVMTVASYSMIKVVGSYVAFVGFEFDGHNIQGYTGYNQNNTNTYFAQGALFDGQGAGHHHMVLNSLCHGTGGPCLGTIGTDYELLAGNEVYDFAGVNPCSASGIGYYEATQLPSFTPTLPWDTQTFHIQVINNVVHDGGLTAAQTGSCGTGGIAITDGNGIIIDDFAHLQNPPIITYPFGTLVLGNITYNIGGRGVYAMEGSNVFTANNLLPHVLDHDLAYKRRTFRQ